MIHLINQKFGSHVGHLDKIWVPTNRNTAKKWASNFITHRLLSFGDYEDAIDYRSDFLFHSAVSPILNIGLITPSEMIELLPKISGEIPINSLEGFYRQLIGWREFIRGIYHHYHETQSHRNFFNHQYRLNHQWDNGTTGIPPLDDAIKQILRLGYTHHINRLMIIGNMMLLCRIHPHDVYNWFMRFFLDSADWVMGPNVFGMSQFSDGGIFATKPYFCGSNYILKMSHYAKGEWCRIVDALYWQFVCDNQAFLSTNYRLKFMVSTYNRFSSDKKTEIETMSHSFIKSVTFQHPTH
jgi:deoxyribodipyrimidine photolyase-related protein